MGTEMLPLRCAQGFGSCAQHDIPSCGCYISLSRQGQSGGATQVQVGHAPTPRRDKSRGYAPMITSADL
jgi:hypothetical protein